MHITNPFQTTSIKTKTTIQLLFIITITYYESALHIAMCRHYSHCAKIHVVYFASDRNPYEKTFWLIWKNLFLVYDYDDDDLECNLPLLEGAQITATSSLPERGPNNARLNGEYYKNTSPYSIFSIHNLFFCIFCCYWFLI